MILLKSLMKSDPKDLGDRIYGEEEPDLEKTAKAKNSSHVRKFGPASKAEPKVMEKSCTVCSRLHKSLEFGTCDCCRESFSVTQWHSGHLE